jgi:subtilase family serine protease
MQESKHLRKILASLIGLALLAALAGRMPPTGQHMASAAPASRGFKAHSVEVQPIIRELASLQNSFIKNAGVDVRAVLFACQSNDHPRPVLCYGPSQIRHAYGVSSLLANKITGKGSSITIIDAYGSPTIRKDLRAFDSSWGLPNARLNIIAPFGVHGSDSIWTAETSLDVEWAHVTAPEATINLVVAKNSDDVELYKALNYTVKHNLGDIISLSFGENEHCIDPALRRAEHNVFREAVKKGMTLLAATGDYGSAQPTCDNSSYQKAISFPASDPLVTAVGGTELTADAATGHYEKEIVWNESNTYNKASGGGFSTIYRAPSYQSISASSPASSDASAAYQFTDELSESSGKGVRGRGVPDISLNASVNGGVVVYQSNPSTGKVTLNIMGGTSVGTPELAGMLADGVQMAHHRLGAINPALYRLGRSSRYQEIMHDILSGNNTLSISGLSGYTAKPGWNAATGWGSPGHAEEFLRALIEK